jgi:hypothetical protein
MFALASQLLRRGAGASALATIVALSAGQLAAQSADPFHWGFGAAFGRGTYRLEDGTEVEIYRAQFRPPVGKAQNEDSPDAEDRRGPGERFTLRTSVQGGWARELGGAEESARLASVGVRGRLKFTDAPARPALIFGLLWGAVDPSEGERSALLRSTTALELDIPVPRWRVRGHPMRLLPHVLEDRFFRDEPTGDLPNELGSEQQVGVAAGRDEPFKIWFVKFDAVGIAYRFSDRSKGFRLYLNSVF